MAWSDVRNFIFPNTKLFTETFPKIGDFFSGLWNDYTGKTVNDQNLAFQRENLDYQKALQQQIFEREDTSYQRTANDLLKAGLNPLSMQGTNGSGEAIATTPLQNTTDVGQNKMNAIFGALNAINGIASTADSLSSGSLQRDALSLENDRKILENFELANDLGLDYSPSTKLSGKRGSVSGFDTKDFLDSKGSSSRSKNIASMLSDEQLLDFKREFAHKKSRKLYDSDIEMERTLNAVETFITDPNLKNRLKTAGFSIGDLLKFLILGK